MVPLTSRIPSLRVQAFDKDKDGFITRDEFRKALAKDCALSADDVTELIKEADIDGDGKIRCDACCAALCSGAL